MINIFRFIRILLLVAYNLKIIYKFYVSNRIRLLSGLLIDHVALTRSSSLCTWQKGRIISENVSWLAWFPNRGALNLGSGPIK